MPTPLHSHRNESGNYKITDEELVLLYLETQRSRYFDVLYQRYVEKVYCQCFSIVKDHVSAEDLTQDVFIKLICKMNSFNHLSKFSTWLFAISRNHCVDYLYSVKRKGEVWFNTEMEIPDDKNPYDSFELEETAILQLKTSLDQLTVDEKKLLYMKYIDKISIHDIAHVLRTSESAIKMRLVRSKEKLRENYKKAAEFMDVTIAYSSLREIMHIDI